MTEAYFKNFSDMFSQALQTAYEQKETEKEKKNLSSVFMSDNFQTYSASFFDYSSEEEEITTSSGASGNNDNSVDNAVNFFANYSALKNSVKTEDYPEELLTLFNQKINIIEKTFEQLKNKDLSDEEIVANLNELIANILNTDNEFLAKIFDELKDNPKELESVLSSKLSSAAEKQALLESKIEEYCDKNSINPELKGKIFELIKNANIEEINNLQKFVSDKNSPLSEIQKQTLLKSTETEKAEIEAGIKEENAEETEKNKEELRQILNNLPKEEREKLVENINNAHLELVKKLKTALKTENSFEARILAFKEFDEKMNTIMQEISKKSILHNIACKNENEAKSGIEDTKNNLTNINKLTLRRKLNLLRSNKDKNKVLELELKNTGKRHQSYMLGAQEAFDEKPTEVNTVEATFKMFEDVSTEHIKFASEEAPKEFKLSKTSQEKLKELSEKIKNELNEIHKKEIKKFWESSAGQKCIEYTKKMLEYRRAEYLRRKKETIELKEKCIEKRKLAKKAQKIAFAKKEAAKKIKQQIIAKQDNMKKKLGLSSDFKLTDAILKNVDYNLAIKKKQADNEFSIAKKDMINAESDMRLANYFLLWAEKMANYEKNLCNVCENFLA